MQYKGSESNITVSRLMHTYLSVNFCMTEGRVNHFRFNIIFSSNLCPLVSNIRRLEFEDINEFHLVFFLLYTLTSFENVVNKTRASKESFDCKQVQIWGHKSATFLILQLYIRLFIRKMKALCRDIFICPPDSL
jgi:hypothetical protein